MKIKLISPRMSLRPMDSEFKRGMAPSLSLLVLAALTPSQYTVTIEDENVARINLDDAPDLVGITVNVDTSNRAYEISSHYRRKNIPVVLGGIHVSAMPDEASSHADAVCIGEAEELWGKILSDSASRRLRKRYHSAGTVNIFKTPLPRRDLINQSSYLYTNVLTTSRGCPFKCEFCYNSCAYMHGGFRNRSVESVIKEINSFDTRQVMFIDDNFIGNIEWTKEFVKAIKPLRLRWHAAVSTNIGLHPELLDQMQDSGCKSLFIGFESINRDSIQSVNKHQNYIEQYGKLIDALHSHGIMINASMVFGFDHDYSGVFEDTLQWLVRSKIETITAHILTPYPGTLLFKRFQREGRIVDYDWNHYNTSNVVYRPKNMTAQELYDGYIGLYNEFYSWKNIFKRMPVNRKQRIPYLLFNLGYRKYGKITSQIAKFGLMNTFGKFARRIAYGID
jgi:radical SAM superfamily enzyme YgiQ (UPF0313 family)